MGWSTSLIGNPDLVKEISVDRIAFSVENLKAVQEALCINLKCSV